MVRAGFAVVVMGCSGGQITPAPSMCDVEIVESGLASTDDRLGFTVEPALDAIRGVTEVVVEPADGSATFTRALAMAITPTSDVEYVVFHNPTDHSQCFEGDALRVTVEVSVDTGTWVKADGSTTL